VVITEAPTDTIRGREARRHRIGAGVLADSRGLLPV